ncbi:hypothetical protein [Pseudoalteromonas sp. SR45-4]|uniref:hypothetical protein n=1 Tax=Pseudoalteromonas sp. SR45-4 TaxID=2760929 RepID=UPI0015FC1E97|nr:hypothetical protein [Pseudoalteromonas sp. SR45-4]MBB1371324.1 hypothetical protein [Pseudoalteromonas sp. SR45-4]
MKDNRFKVEVTDVNVVTLTFTDPPCPPVKITGQEAGILSSLLSNARHTSGMHASTDRNQFVEALNLQDEPTDPLKLIKQWKASIARTSDINGKRYWLPAMYLLAGKHDKARLQYLELLTQFLKDDQVFDSLEFIWAAILSELPTAAITHIKSSSRVANLVRCLYSNPFALKIMLKDNTVTPFNKTHRGTNKASYSWAVSHPNWFMNLATESQLESLRRHSETTIYKSYTETVDKLTDKAMLLPNASKESNHAFNELYSYEKMMINL